MLLSEGKKIRLPWRDTLWVEADVIPLLLKDLRDERLESAAASVGISCFI
jgi:hypothetical protein